jgi:hypothetical protein
MAERALVQLKNKIPLDKVTIPSLVHKQSSAKADGNPLAPTAGETSDFTRATPYLPVIGQTEGFREQAFKLSDAHQTPAEVFEAKGNFYAIRLKSLKEADMAKFDEEKAAITSSLLYPRQRAMIQQYIAYLKSNARIKYNKELTGSAEIKV